MLIVLAGLPGSGKSTVGRMLAGELPAVILDKDPIRAALFPPDEIEYSRQQDDFCLDIMLEVASYMWAKDADKLVIIDGRPFAYRYQRQVLTRTAEQQGTRAVFIEFVCSDETARRRLEQAAPGKAHPARNRDYDLYLSLKAAFEPLEEERLVVDTDLPLDECLARALAYIRAQSAT